MFANSILLLAAGLVFGGFLIIVSSAKRSAHTAAYIGMGSLAAALATAIVAIIRRLGHAGIPGQSQSHILIFNWLPLLGDAGHAGMTMIQCGISSSSLNLIFFMIFLIMALLTQIHTLGMLKSRELPAVYFAMTNLTAFLLLLAALSINVMQVYILLQLAFYVAWYMMQWSNRPPEYVIARRMLLPLWLADALFLMGAAVFALHGSPLDRQILFGHVSLGTGGIASGSSTLIPGLGRWFPGLTWRSVGGVCLVAGALSKAGQFPFHTWVPETITGYSGGNAMLSGTLIASGGLLLLVHSLGLLNLNAALTLAMMGATTQFCAALIALVQKDIKRTLAWLLIAQGGLNFLFFGSGDYAAGLLAALLTGLVYGGLFLAAGTVLRANGGQRDITQLGGGWRHLPITASATGLLVIGVGGLGFSGMTAVIQAGLLHTHAYGWGIGEFGRFLYWVPVVMCYVTALAMARWWWLIFAGPPRGEPWEAGEMAVQTFPLLVLLVGAILAAEPFVDLSGLFTQVLGVIPEAGVASIPSGFGGMMLRPLAWLGPAAFAAAAMVYGGGMRYADLLRRRPGPNLVYRWLAADMYVADLFGAALGFPVLLAGRMAAFVDRWVVEWLLVSLAVLTRLASILVAAAETGLNSSCWECLIHPSEQTADRLRALRRRGGLYILTALAVVLVVTLVAAYLRR
ncbi:MAG: proton-conducting transporter membrane subunit [Phycisphaerae bacterium]